MRLARNLLLAATAALAAMAFMTTTAFAQSTEIHDETNGGVHCGDVEEAVDHNATGGCLVHVVSEDLSQTAAHTGLTEAITTTCENEFNARISEDGTGYIITNDTTIHVNPAAGCVLTPCDEPSPSHQEREWPLSGLAETGGDEAELILTFCIRAINTAEGSQGNACTIPVDVVTIPGTHDQEFTADDESCFQNEASELTGHWLTETEDEGDEVNIEIEHGHYPGV